MFHRYWISGERVAGPSIRLHAGDRQRDTGPDQNEPDKPTADGVPPAATGDAVAITFWRDAFGVARVSGQGRTPRSALDQSN
jgi:hypothetical protein